MESLKAAGFFFLATRRILPTLYIFFISVCLNNKYRHSFSFTGVTALVTVCMVSFPLQITMIVIGECNSLHSPWMILSYTYIVWGGEGWALTPILNGRARRFCFGSKRSIYSGAIGCTFQDINAKNKKKDRSYMAITRKSQLISKRVHINWVHVLY